MVPLPLTTHRFRASYLHSITRRIFSAAGAPRPIADVVAGILVNANLAGHDSHGVLRIPEYLGLIERGRLRADAEPTVLSETASTLLLDGNNGFGHNSARLAMARAIEKARRSAICCVNLVRPGHIGRLGEYAEQAAHAGCIGIITVGSGQGGRGSMTPYGGARGAFGTNPIAVGVPTGDDVPFIIDYATSMVAEGKLRVARSKGEDLPEGCIVDRHGVPSVKPEDFYDGGYLLPFGNHKGYALALLTCLLGGLSGRFDVEHGAMDGAYLQAIDVAALTPLESYHQGVRAFLDGIRRTPPAPGFDAVLVPGDFEHRSRRQRLVHGIEVPDVIYRQIEECAGRFDVSLGEDAVAASDIERYVTE
jgi:LDH2 family malate/lactate/ureidoglycolate dehydrogenase